MTRDNASTSAAGPSRWTRLIRFARSHGKARALYRLLRRLAETRVLRGWVRFFVTEVFRVPVSDVKRYRRIPRTFTVRKAGETDQPALESYFADSQRVRNRLRRQDLCVIAVSKGKIGAAVWLALGPKDYQEDWRDLRCVLRVPAGVCWTFDGLGTAFGAWGILMACLPPLLEELGASEVYTQIECDNQVSLDSHKSLGYQSAGLIGCFGIGPCVLRVYRPHGQRWRLVPGWIGSLEVCGKKEA
ncbi:MAG: hypothetical protein JXB62_17665 [Pirellulales bacterium]|nr:hypothetical protein [Pirellulales bacterium]